jgi:hypothetical protein
MKGYTEVRGQVFKLVFDATSKQFVSQPTAHDFQPRTAASVVAQQQSDIHKRHRSKKSRSQVTKLLADMGPQLRDDIGMTEVFAASFYP